MEWSTKEWQHNYKQLGDANMKLDNKISEVYISFYNDKPQDFTYDGVIVEEPLAMTDGNYLYQVHLTIKKNGD
ncbi:hypothetical protein ACM0K4_00230 [Mycoplasma sp. VS42A]|uniref:hypothetical protein n=1 Tax=Mycoplasma sp. VS42A TaxID=3398774 RepID=UPI003A88D424